MSAPDEPTKENLDECRRCELWQNATQGVPGEGPRTAALLLIGEQPGNEEDLTGRPFIGPAGRLLRQLLREAGIDPRTVYITNAVKHFYFDLRGQRRLHRTPLQRHIAACHAWLEAEVACVQPRVIVTLGTTALGAVLGRKLSIAAARGEALLAPPGVVPLFATYHPAAVLRVPDARSRTTMRAALLSDLQRAAEAAAKP
jgi:uracil-DNA glycosylase